MNPVRLSTLVLVLVMGLSALSAVAQVTVGGVPL